MEEAEEAREQGRRSSITIWSIRVIGALIAAFAAALVFVPWTPAWIAASIAAAGALTAALGPHLIESLERKPPQRNSPSSTKVRKRNVEKLIERLKHGDERGRREAALELSKLGGAAEVALPDLIQALDDPDPHVRENATQALEAGGSAAVRHLVVALRHQKGLGFIGPIPMTPRPVPRLREVMGEDDVRAALVGIGPAAVPALMDAVKEGAPTVRAPIAAALKAIQSGELDQVIMRAASEEDDEIRLSGAIALAESASAENVPALAALLQDRDPRVRVCAIAGLGRTGSEEALAPLTDTLNREEDSKVRYEAVRAFGRLAEHDLEAVPALVRALEDPSLLVQLAAVAALGETGPAARASVPELLDGLKHADWTLRRHAAEALGKIGAHEAVPALTEALEDGHDEVREAAAEAIERIQPK